MAEYINIFSSTCWLHLPSSKDLLPHQEARTDYNVMLSLCTIWSCDLVFHTTIWLDAVPLRSLTWKLIKLIRFRWCYHAMKTVYRQSADLFSIPIRNIGLLLVTQFTNHIRDCLLTTLETLKGVPHKTVLAITLNGCHVDSALWIQLSLSCWLSILQLSSNLIPRPPSQQ